jgi:integrase
VAAQYGSQPGQAGHLAALLAVWGAAAVKAVAALLPLLAIGVWPRTANGGLRRLARVLTWIETAILTGYGLIPTASGLLIQAGVIKTAAHADRLALKWHAYLWDPWFLIWGIFVFLALWRSRPASQDHLPGRTPGAVQGWQSPDGRPRTFALVFTGDKGGPCNRAAFNWIIWVPARRRAGIPDRAEDEGGTGMHQLRHHFASLLLRGGVDPKRVQEWLDRHSAAFTLDIYGHLMPDEHEASLRQVEAIFAAALRSAPDGPVTAQPGGEGR